MIGALIGKEWRENRWLVLGFVVLAPMFSLGLKWGIVGWRLTVPGHSIQAVIPILTLLYLLAIGADLIASDTASGRIGFLLALPVRPWKVWAAKATFLFGGALLFVGYLLVVETAILALAGKSVWQLFKSDSMMWMHRLVPVLVAGAAALAFSAFVDRGLAAALLALSFVGAIMFAASHLEHWELNPKPDGPLFYQLGAVIGAGLLAASLAATTLGRIHLGARLRRVVLAATVFLVVTVPPTAWAGVRHHRWLRLEPHQHDLQISKLLENDPTGQWLLVEVTRPGVRSPRKTGPLAYWAVNLSSGTVRDLTRRGWIRPRAHSWSEGADRVALYRTKSGPEGKTPIHLRVVYDLKKGEVVSTRPIAPDSPYSIGATRRGPLTTESLRPSDGRAHRHLTHREGREPLKFSGEWSLTNTAREWGLIVTREVKGKGWLYGVLMTETGEVHHLYQDPTLLPSSPDRPAWALETRGTGNHAKCWIDRVPLDGFPGGAVVEGKGWRSADPTLTRAIACLDGDTWWVDADADGPVELEDLQFTESSPTRPFIYWSNDGRVCLAIDGENAFRITADARRPFVERILLPLFARLSPKYVPWFDGERAAVLCRGYTGQSTLRVVNLDGTQVQLLPILEDD